MRMPVLELDYKVSIVDTTKCIITVANKVGVSEMAKQYATNLIDEVTKKGNECRKKSVGLAARLYILCIKTNENISQRIIADATRITELTLRNRLRDIKSQLHLKRTLRNSTCSFFTLTHSIERLVIVMTRLSEAIISHEHASLVLDPLQLLRLGTSLSSMLLLCITYVYRFVLYFAKLFY